MLYKKLKYILIVILLVSCAKPQPSEDQITGTWKGLDGARIELNANHKVKIVNYPLNLNNSNFKGTLNGSGTWKIYKDKRDPWWSIEILAENDKMIPELQSKGIAIELFITQSGLLGNGSQVKNLFIWKGDPDLDDRYQFYKN
ncbi:hypothetical protein [Aquimarina spongiae]|uniref:Uncharacterized protein n=1 Tax=Aquimarina spongiae TaxID=570521 RepID=A0A1M6LLC6_9FLAO|nr:hypothetical protein [Aquimarina spongiae]SHJ71975.1 hypothetical protein SAMN04488508_11920 [Aquimarina spongiae]